MAHLAGNILEHLSGNISWRCVEKRNNVSLLHDGICGSLCAWWKFSVPQLMVWWVGGQESQFQCLAMLPGWLITQYLPKIFKHSHLNIFSFSNRHHIYIFFFPPPFSRYVMIHPVHDWIQDIAFTIWFSHNIFERKWNAKYFVTRKKLVIPEHLFSYYLSA